MTPTYLAAVAAQHGLDPDAFAEAVKQIQDEQEAYTFTYNSVGGHVDLFRFPPAAQVPPDTTILDMLSAHSEWHIDREWEDGDDDWIVCKVEGCINDREYKEVGRGKTLRAALLAAAPEYKEE